MCIVYCVMGVCLDFKHIVPFTEQRFAHYNARLLCKIYADLYGTTRIPVKTKPSTPCLQKVGLFSTLINPGFRCQRQVSGDMSAKKKVLFPK